MSTPQDKDFIFGFIFLLHICFFGDFCFYFLLFFSVRFFDGYLYSRKQKNNTWHGAKKGKKNWKEKFFPFLSLTRSISAMRLLIDDLVT